MYCYIQEIKLKTPYRFGESKEIEPITYNIGGKTIYSYIMSEERFIRDKNIAYKITLHHSYRVDGVVKKKQWHITTMNYYDIIEFWIGDCISSSKLEKILDETGLKEETFYNLIDEKLDPLIQKFTTEYHQTEEYKTHLKHMAIISKHNKREREFDNKYGFNTYKECYNIFGELMNEDRLNELKEDYKRKQEQSSYYEQYKRNYDKQYTSSYFTSTHGNYNEDERKLLKEAFKLLAMKYHPDRNPDKNTTEIMATINNLKEKIL